MTMTIFHNPACGTSRNVLALIRQAGIEPAIVEYLQTPPSGPEILALARQIGAPLRDLLRRKGTPYAALGLDDPAVGDDALLAAIAGHPVLLNRPIVVSPKGTKLCRPSDVVLDLLPDTALLSQAISGEAGVKEDGAPLLRPVPVAPDDPGLLAMLAAADLPVSDLAPAGDALHLFAPAGDALHLFAFDTLDGARVGYGGWEEIDGGALIRSVVVDPARRGMALGRGMVALLLFRIWESGRGTAGPKAAWLLTTSAAGFFARLGFTEVARADAPAAVLATPQAAGLCPASAVLMTRPLGF